MDSGQGRPSTIQFPAGLRVLLVDDGYDTLAIQELLQTCQYQVTTCITAKLALSRLREDKTSFDVMLCEFRMPDGNGFDLLEAGNEMGIPVVLMSYTSEIDVVMKGVKQGACDYLVKPVRYQEIRNLWQHALRSKERIEQHQTLNNGVSNLTMNDAAKLASNTDKLKDIVVENSTKETDSKALLKKKRVQWSSELHLKFMKAIGELGINDAKPQNILDLMNVPGLTRAHVASHLQKLRLKRRREAGQNSENLSEIVNSVVDSRMLAQPSNFGAQEPNMQPSHIFSNQPMNASSSALAPLPPDGSFLQNNQVNQSVEDGRFPMNLSSPLPTYRKSYQSVVQYSKALLQSSYGEGNNSANLMNQVGDGPALFNHGRNYIRHNGMRHIPSQNRNSVGVMPKYTSRGLAALPLSSYVGSSNGMHPPLRNVNDIKVANNYVTTGSFSLSMPYSDGSVTRNLQNMQGFGMTAMNTKSEQQGNYFPGSYAADSNGSSMDDFSELDDLLDFDQTEQGGRQLLADLFGFVQQELV